MLTKMKSLKDKLNCVQTQEKAKKAEEPKTEKKVVSKKAKSKKSNKRK